MAEFRLRIEKLEPGRVQGIIWDVESAEMSGTEHLLWQLEVAQDSTKGAQAEVFKAACNYLNRFVVLSSGGAD